VIFLPLLNRFVIYGEIKLINTVVTESISRLIEKKLDYQLKWILDNQNEYSNEFVLAAREELARREQSEKSLITDLLNKITNFFKI